MVDLLWNALSGHPVRNSHAQVVDRVGGAIVAGRFPPGAALPRDEELEAHFRVSRTVLREAFKTLAAKGLLVARTRVGTRVRPRDEWNLLDADVLRWRLDAGAGPDFVRELAEMRLGVEPYAAALAAGRADEAAIDRLWAQLGVMEGGGDTAAFAHADFLFHREVMRASGNAFMQSVGALIGTALLASFRISSPAASPESKAQVAADHLRILEAIAARDAPAAEAAMRHVIVVGRDRVAGAATPAVAGEAGAAGAGAPPQDGEAGGPRRDAGPGGWAGS